MNKSIITLWAPVKDFEDCYLVSTTGQIKSLDRHIKTKSKNGLWSERLIKGRILKPCFGRNGYILANLMNGGKNKKSAKVHRLVAQAFIPNPENKPHINHIDGNPGNNHFENLEWCTHQENMRHAVDTGLIVNFNPAKGSKSNFSKLVEEQVIEIKQRLANDENPVDISSDYPVGASCIKEIKAGRSWGHIE